MAHPEPYPFLTKNEMKAETGFALCACCRQRTFPEKGGNAEEVIDLERLVPIPELFPLNSAEMKISLNLEKEGSLSASFLKSEGSSSPGEKSNTNSELFDHSEEITKEHEVQPKENIEEFKGDKAEDKLFGTKILEIRIEEEAQKSSSRKSNTGIFNPSKNHKFSPEEDEKLKELVKIHGEGSWSCIAEQIPGKNRKQVRERYINFLKKERSVQDFSQDEDLQILSLVKEYGRKWNFISNFLPGRTPIMIKNRYYARLQSLFNDKPNKRKNNLPLPQNEKMKSGPIFADVVAKTKLNGNFSPQEVQEESKSEIMFNEKKQTKSGATSYNSLSSMNPGSDAGIDNLQLLKDQELQLQNALCLVTAKIIKFKMALRETGKN